MIAPDAIPFEEYRQRTAHEHSNANHQNNGWPAPEVRFLKSVLPQAPELPLDEVMCPQWAQWIREAAESKAAPADYVMAAVLSAAGSLLGNARWASPWSGWNEPPIIWTMLIGTPSSSKSPALDAVLTAVRRVEKLHRNAAEAKLQDWEKKAELAKLAESAWKEAVKAALKNGDAPPEKTEAASAGPRPHLPRLVVNDVTIEKIAVIVSQQPRGTLQARDELAGFLGNMVRYAGGSSDRPFWLEAYGGRGYTVERMGREPVSVDRLTVSVVGGIQPDRLKSLLLTADDDGLLARFIPVWPELAPVCRPRVVYGESFIEAAFGRLYSLPLIENQFGEKHPWFVPFAPDAAELLDQFRQSVRSWEAGDEGLLLSFIGKLNGLAVRLSLVLAYLDWAVGSGTEPTEISLQHFARAAHLIEAYFLPMARRAYAEASLPQHERAARRLVAIIQEQGWRHFTSRDVLRLERSGLRQAKEVDAALAALVEGDVIRPAAAADTSNAGRPRKAFDVNPALFGG